MLLRCCQSAENLPVVHTGNCSPCRRRTPTAPMETKVNEVVTGFEILPSPSTATARDFVDSGDQPKDFFRPSLTAIRQDAIFHSIGVGECQLHVIHRAVIRSRPTYYDGQSLVGRDFGLRLGRKDLYFVVLRQPPRPGRAAAKKRSKIAAGTTPMILRIPPLENLLHALYAMEEHDAESI